jgi:hypothetical protein
VYAIDLQVHAFKQPPDVALLLMHVLGEQLRLIAGTAGINAAPASTLTTACWRLSCQCN